MMLLPPVMCEEAEVDITEAVNLYKDDCPSPEQIESEVYRWRQRYIIQHRGSPTDFTTHYKIM